MRLHRTVWMGLCTMNGPLTGIAVKELCDVRRGRAMLRCLLIVITVTKLLWMFSRAEMKARHDHLYMV